MFEGDSQDHSRGSSSLPLHLRNNETVISDITQTTYDSAHTSLMNPASRGSVASSQSRGSGSRSRGADMGLALSGIIEGEEYDDHDEYDERSSEDDINYRNNEEEAYMNYQPSEASIRSSLNNNSLHGSFVSSSSASYVQQCRPNRHTSHLNNSLRSSNASIISSGTSSSRRRHQQHHDASTVNTTSTFNTSSVITSLIQANQLQQQQVIENYRLISHNPKTATQEVNVSEYQDAIPNSDETSSLPDEYYEDNADTQFRRKSASDATVTTVTGGDSSNQDTEVEMLSSSMDIRYKSPFSMRRRWYSLISVLTALSLAVTALKISVDSLSTTMTFHSTTNRAPPASHVSDYIPGYKFGGGLGGLKAGQEQERRMNLAYNQYGIELLQPQHQSSSQLRRPNGREMGARVSRGGSTLTRSASYNEQAPVDPFNGFGPPQFNADYGSPPQQDFIQAGLSSTPLTSYIPPPNDHEDGDMSPFSFTSPIITLDPMFHGSMMELSILPYNQFSERPVVWDIPQSGGGAIQSIIGSCLHLVQCNRDYSFNKQPPSSPARRKLMELVTREDVKTVIDESNTMKMNEKDASYEPQKPLHPQIDEDPAIVTRFHRSSTYVNVDCSSPEGVDRGIAHNLVKTDIVDVFYSRDPYDVARLFAPPTEVYGRGIVMIRNPIRRSVATYKRLQIKRPDLVGDMTMEQFAASSLLKDNFLTRTLSRNKDAPLTEADITLAKEILKRKFVVGLYDHFEDSVRRFEAFFGWKLNEDINSCQTTMIQKELELGYNDFGELAFDSSYSAIAEKNRADLELFKFAEYVYKYQERTLFGNMVDDLITM